MEFIVQLDYEWATFIKVVISAILAGLVGIEREMVDKPAGFRTHMIVGGAVALLVSLSEVIVQHFADLPFARHIQSDPIRIIQAVIIGISFIGAGTVLQLKKEFKVKYLTTAATILFASGIGICVALNQFYLAAGVTLLTLFINFVIGYLRDLLIPKNKKS